MGTNYYAKSKELNFDDLHIGKSSCGWKFSFRGYRGYSLTDKITVNLDSFKKWLQFLSNEDIVIINDSGTEVEWTAFCNIVWLSKGKNHYDEVMGGKDFRPKNEWKDEDGFSFIDCDFS